MVRGIEKIPSDHLADEGHDQGGVDGLMFTFKLSYAFDTTTFNQTTSLLQILSKTGGSAGNNIAPNYVDGALFANDGEFQLYGWVPQDLVYFGASC